jgi:quercetin dioxygenase-like cupin family protein
MTTDHAAPVTAAVINDPAVQSAFWFLGGLVQLRAAAGHTGGRFAILEHTARRGYSSPLHVHAVDDETFLVIDGSLRIVCDGEEYLGEPGALAVLPRRSRHGFVVTSRDARFLTLHHPAGFEDFVVEVGTPAPEIVAPAPLEGPPPPELAETLTAAASRHGITLIGPPPRP